MKDHQRLYAAEAHSPEQFCISVVEPDDNDPFSFVLTYDGTLAQPWSRVDVHRTINAVTTITGQGTGPAFAALSNEGDVYFLGAQPVRREKIPGSGAFSPDATGLGRVSDIYEIGGLLHVCGASSQVYRREQDGTWRNLGAAALKPEPGFDELAFRRIRGDELSSLYVGGYGAPSPKKSLTAADYKEMEEAEKRGDWDRVDAIYASAANPDGAIKGRAYHRDTGWKPIALPNTHTIFDVFIEAADKIWMVGFGGNILFGNPVTGFQSLGFRGDRDTLLSFTKLGSRYVAASETGLHWFTGHNLAPLRPTTVASVIPLKVQAVADVLFYFDVRQGVHRYDGATWTEITIPPALLERNFQGLSHPTP